MASSKYKKLSHVVYKCDYHLVWTPKYRFRVLFGEVKVLVENDIRMLCEWKGVEILELNVQIDHVHVICSVPPKVSISDLMGTLKGKLAIKLFKSYPKLKQKPYWGNHFWSRGYFVNTVGVDEDIIRRYVIYQEGEDKKEEGHTRNFDLFSPPTES
ncbi:MAG: IS200/IS605 family transposase [Ferruginibacter sp.]